MRHPLAVILLILLILLAALPASAQKAIERAEELVALYEAVERRQRPFSDLPRDPQRKIAKASKGLEAFLARNPEHARALLASAQLDWLRAVTSPVHWPPAPGETPPPLELDEAHEKLDRALEAAPESSETHYWQAKLYGIPEPAATEGGKRSYKVRDLAKAIEFAERAVALAPGREAYCEWLALLLVRAERFDEACEAVKGFRGGRHPFHLLLADQTAFPLPAAANYSSLHSSSLRSGQFSRGRNAGLAYPLFRAHVYTFAGTLSEIESSLRRRWPDLVLFETYRDEGSEGRLERRARQFFRIQGDDLVPAESEELLSAEAEGILLAVTERTNPTPAELERFEMEAVETFSVISMMNTRRVG